MQLSQTAEDSLVLMFIDKEIHKVMAHNNWFDLNITHNELSSERGIPIANWYRRRSLLSLPREYSCMMANLLRKNPVQLIRNIYMYEKVRGLVCTPSNFTSIYCLPSYAIHAELSDDKLTNAIESPDVWFAGDASEDINATWDFSFWAVMAIDAFERRHLSDMESIGLSDSDSAKQAKRRIDKAMKWLSGLNVNAQEREVVRAKERANDWLTASRSKALLQCS